jgi:serine/threonine protein kinase
MRFQDKVLLSESNICRVYLCYDKVIGKNVILKVYKRENFDIAREEYEFFSKIRYKTPQVYDFFEDEEGNICIVKEYVVGRTLRDVISEQGILPPEISIFISLEILRFLDFICSKGEYNGDITPSNIVITYDGEVKVLDCAKSHNFITPEYYSADEKKSIKSDMKALSKIILEMTDNKKLRKIAQSVDRFSKPEDFLRELYKIINSFKIITEKDLAQFILHQPKFSLYEKNTYTADRKKRNLIAISWGASFIILGILFGFLLMRAREKGNTNRTGNSEVSKISEEGFSQNISQTFYHLQGENTAGHQLKEKDEKENIPSEGKNNSAKERFEKVEKKLKEVKQVKDKSQKAESYHGYISINSIPDCDVFLNGTFIGKTPVVDFKAKEGENVLKLRVVKREDLSNTLQVGTSTEEKEIPVKVEKDRRIFIFADLINNKVEVKAK